MFGFLVWPRRAENQNGWFRDVPTTFGWTRSHERFRKNEERRSLERDAIESPI
jgi:hypothetical protein